LAKASKEFDIAGFKLHLHWQRLCDNAGDRDSIYLLALATLGEATRIGLFLFLVASPKVAEASTVTIDIREYILDSMVLLSPTVSLAKVANVYDPSISMGL
jgi:hypothetical protein